MKGRTLSCACAAALGLAACVLLMGAGPARACPEDVNGDGMVDILDLVEVINAWGSGGGPEDVNGDGVVDILDLVEVINAWGPCP